MKFENGEIAKKYSMIELKMTEWILYPTHLEKRIAQIGQWVDRIIRTLGSMFWLCTF